MLDFNGVFARFLALSLIVHLCAFMLAVWPRPNMPAVIEPPIPVSVLPESPPAPPPAAREEIAPPQQKAAPAPKQEARKKVAKESPRKRPAPALLAKKDSPGPAESRRAQAAPHDNHAESTPRQVPPPEPAGEEPRARPLPPEQTVIAERPLPTLKELLPPVNYSVRESGGPDDNSVSLYTTDPKYVTYVTKVRQSIESQWQYPEMALRYGLQGKLALEFIILENGKLEGLRLIRSSGSALLDQEALRAIKAAAPFPPIPVWIKTNPLRISATMEYRDSRLDYRWTR